MSFYAAKFFSQLTQSLLVAGLFVVASRHADAAVGLSGVLLAGIAAALMFAFVAGAVVDRVGAARAYVGGAALRMLTPLLALLIARDMPGALLVTFAASGLIQVFGPAEMSLVRLLQPRTPAKCHALLVFLQYGGQAVGAAALAPALYFAGGTTLMFAGAAATAVLFFALALVLSRRLPAEAAPAPARQAFAFRPTLRFLAGDDRARYAVGALSLKTAVSRGVFVALPLYIRSDVGVGNIAFGALVGVGVVGAITGLVWSSRGIGEHTANEIATMYGVHPTMIAKWKKQLLEGAEGVFSNGPGPKRPGNHEEDCSAAELYEQIGRLKMQLEWLKKKAERVG